MLLAIDVKDDDGSGGKLTDAFLMEAILALL